MSNVLTLKETLTPFEKWVNQSFNREEFFAAIHDYNDSPTEPDYGTSLDGDVFLPKFRNTSYVMSADLLCCALFGISKGESMYVDGKTRFVRKYIEKTFDTCNGASVEYRGKELRQDDLSVLLHLISLRNGMCTSLTIESSPYALLREMGWSDSKPNVAHLKECLLRLRGALLVIERDGHRGSAIGFVSEFSWDDDKLWSIRLDDSIVCLFQKSTTYLSISKRSRLTEGLQTWLYGYIRANRCGWAVPLAVIHKSCGSAATDMTEFARSVRDALRQLALADVITDASTVKAGKVAIFKV